MRRPLRGAIAVLAGIALAIPGVARATPSTSSTPEPTSDSQTATPSTQTVRVMVTLDDQPTTASDSSEATYLAEQNQKLADWTNRFGLTVHRQFGYLVNGFSADVPQNEVAALKSQPGVKTVEKVRTYERTMDTAGSLTQSVQARNDFDVDGTGMVVAVIDTGIDASHQDMRLSDAGAAGAKITNVKEGSQFSLKVPYGRNFADENDDVKDTGSGFEPHGMHVSGIVAADGGEDANAATNGRINGIAPNAQLLAMKVFSNDPSRSGGASSDDIIAAIEDSVKHQADVINMSLGSVNGFSSSDYGEQKAVQTATDAGVLVVISAGNSGVRSSADGSTNDLYGTLDDGSVGSPGAAGSALTVASVENSTIASRIATFSWSGGTGADLTGVYNRQTGYATKAELADGGLGKPEELTKVSGKLAFIKRGELNFSDKIANAFAAGATGVLVWNNETGGDETLSMQGTDGHTEFIGSIGNTTGQKIEDQLKAGKTVTADLTDEVTIDDNPASLTPSSFTSWGPTPSLDFKPNISGIGGNVYSTFNDNTYGVMSGTSMASPHVAGIGALILEKYAQEFPNVSTVDRVKLLKTSLSNTAEILKNSDGIAYAPRQVGAGLAQTEDALTTKVFATVDGSESVALKEITAPRTLTVTLDNKGTTDQTYTTGDSTVLAESNVQGEDVTTSANTEETVTPSSGSVTVPAGGSATVKFVVTPKVGDAHYLEGWLALTSTDASQPDLKIPFLGFVGDWNAEPIVDAPVDSGNAFIPGLLTQLMGTTDSAGTRLETTDGDSTDTLTGGNWISPNGDRVHDSVFPVLTLLRGAEHIDYQILDSSGKQIATAGQSNEVSTFALQNVVGLTASPAYYADEGTFDGTVWDQARGADVTAPDGRYTFRVSATVADGYAPQTTDMSFGVDTTAPELTFVSAAASGKDEVLTYRFSDALSGWGGAKALVGNDQTVVKASDLSDDGTFTVTIPNAAADPASAGYAVVQADDAAHNVSSDTHFFQDGVIVENTAALAAAPINDQTTASDGSPLITNGTVPVVVKATEGIATVRSQDGTSASVDPTTHEATLAVPIHSGATTTITVSGYDSSGAQVGTTADVSVTYDVVAPTLTLTSPTPNDDGQVSLADDGTLTIKGRVTDDLARTPAVHVDGKTQDVAADGSFSTTIKPTGRFVVVSAFDGVNWTNKLLELPESQTSGSDLVRTINLSLADRAIGLNADSKNVKKTSSGVVYHVVGVLNRTPKVFTIGGKSVSVAKDGSFSFDLPLTEGLNDVNIHLVDSDGTEAFNDAQKIYYDETAPEFTIETPVLTEDTLYTSKANVTLSGTVTDNATGYTLKVNSDVVQTFDGNETGEAARKAWTWKGAVADGDTLRVTVVDGEGNSHEVTIPVVVDTDLPVISIDGLPSNGVIGEGQDSTVTVTATDPHLDTATVLLDGQSVDVTAPSAGSGTAAAKPIAGSLQATIRTKDLSAGVHTITATATDKAGNTQTSAQTFIVDPLPVIGGPDSVTIDPGQQWSLSDHWNVTDDTDGATLDADLSKLVLGDNEVVLTATDSLGLTTTRTVHIVLEHPESTLTADCGVTMTAAFVDGDSLSATCSTDGNTQTVELSNAKDAINGRITIPASGDVSLYQLVDGERQVMRFESDGTTISFLGSSDATYVLVWPSSGSNGGGTNDGGAVTPATTVSGTQGSLSATGSNALTIGGIAVLLVLIGGIAVVIARKRKPGE